MWNLIVLDYCHGRAWLYTGFEAPLDSDEAEDFVAERHTLSDCHWLFTEFPVEHVIVN